MNHRRIDDVTVLSDYAEVPGLGFLPVNSYVLHAEQPVVIDTGLSMAEKDFVFALAEVLDPPTCDGCRSPTRTAITPAVSGRSSKLRRQLGW